MSSKASFVHDRAVYGSSWASSYWPRSLRYLDTLLRFNSLSLRLMRRMS